MIEIINNEIVIQSIKNAIIAVLIYYTNFRLINIRTKYNCLEIFKIICVIISGSISYIAGYMTMFITQIVLLIILISVIFSFSNVKNSMLVTTFSLIINYSILLLSIIGTFILSKIFCITNSYLNLFIILTLDILILNKILKIKKIKYGVAFFRDSKQNQDVDLLVLNSGIVILSTMIMIGGENLEIIKKMVPVIMINIIMLCLTIQKMLQLYYKQKIMINEMQQLNEEIKAKDKDIKKLEQENLNFSKKSHSLAHKQKSLEYKLNQLLLNSEISEEQDLKNQLEQISTELYSKPVIDLAKTEITKIDDMLKFMQSECIKNNIDFNLQITGNVYYIINNLITEDQLEILIADHVKDAIIAIKHTDNINKSILVRLGKIDDIYGLYIYDSGVEFEKETLDNLGKKPSTTHTDEGGTGMGFMNTFDTLKKCKASLVIDEIGKPSKENFTKVIMIKFDGKDEFRVESYRK